MAALVLLFPVAPSFRSCIACRSAAANSSASRWPATGNGISHLQFGQATERRQLLLRAESYLLYEEAGIVMIGGIANRIMVGLVGLHNHAAA